MPLGARPEPRPVRLADVLPRTVRDEYPQLDVNVTGVSLDSRTVRSGDLYAALPGHLTHGANFVHAAVSAGAVAVLTDDVGAVTCRGAGVPVVAVAHPRQLLGDLSSLVYGEPAKALHVIGVTGTNGKTTVSSMVESGLRSAGHTTGNIGTVGVRVAGVEYPGVRTTPEAPDLQAFLAVMRDGGVDSVVMEVSSIAIEEHRVDGLRFDVAAFTNLSQDHLDYHATMEDYFSAKARLFQPERARFGIVGVDDEWGRRLATQAAVPIQTWSLLDPHADWYVVRSGQGLSIVGPEGEQQSIAVSMPGAFNVANAVCAYAVLRRAGVDSAAAAAGIGQTVVPGRMQVVAERLGVVGIVDYAHTPDAIELVLRAAREEYSGRVIAVVGAGGDRDRGKRPGMGRVAARFADVLVITDDNPRSEDPAVIRESIREGAEQVAPGDRAEVHQEADRRTAITVAVRSAEAGDVVLVLGKGHEQGQDAAGVIAPFDDASELRRAIMPGDPQ